MPVTEKKNVD